MRSLLLALLMGCPVVGLSQPDTTFVPIQRVATNKLAPHLWRTDAWLDRPADKLYVPVLSRDKQLSLVVLSASSGQELERHPVPAQRKELTERIELVCNNGKLHFFSSAYTDPTTITHGRYDWRTKSFQVNRFRLDDLDGKYLAHFSLGDTVYVLQHNPREKQFVLYQFVEGMRQPATLVIPLGKLDLHSLAFLNKVFYLHDKSMPIFPTNHLQVVNFQHRFAFIHSPVAGTATQIIVADFQKQSQSHYILTLPQGYELPTNQIGEVERPKVSAHVGRYHMSFMASHSQRTSLWLYDVHSGQLINEYHIRRTGHNLDPSVQFLQQNTRFSSREKKLTLPEFVEKLDLWKPFTLLMPLGNLDLLVFGGYGLAETPILTIGTYNVPRFAYAKVFIANGGQMTQDELFQLGVQDVFSQQHVVDGSENGYKYVLEDAEYVVMPNEKQDGLIVYKHTFPASATLDDW